MKKYLIKGALALFAGGLLFGCTEKETEYVPIVQQKVKAFEDVFKETFGEIDPYQNWGFATTYTVADESTSEVVYIDSVVTAQTRTRAFARTRGDKASPNANEWGATWHVPETLTNAQKLRARLYFQYNRNPRSYTVDLHDFFVQQVYKGGDNPLNDGQTASLSQYSLEKYKFGSNMEIGSNHMDWLTAGSDHDHINNFNNGTCSTNNDVWDGSLDPDKTKDFNDRKIYHSDQIMLMVGSKTDCFGWHETQGDIQHDDQYVYVSGDVIDAWATSAAAIALGIDLGASVSGRGFVGFDYEARVGDVFEHEWIDLGNGQWGPNPEPKKNDDGIPYISSGTYDNMGSVQIVDPNTPGAYPVWQRYVDGQQSKGNVWVKVGCADGYYSDWIVCITPGDGKTPTAKEDITNDTTYLIKKKVLDQSGRIFCEDLGVSSREDLDFNDVVFDVNIYMHYDSIVTRGYTLWSNGGHVPLENTSVTTRDQATYTCEIILQAAGGTIPLTVANQDVHNAFNVGLTTMVNTRDDNTRVNGTFAECPAVNLGEFTYDQMGLPSDKYTSTHDMIYAIDIPVCVNYNNGVGVLGSSLGGAPAKIFVPNQTTKWTVERKPLSLAYPNFAAYVGNRDIKWWDDSFLTSDELDRANYYRHGNAVNGDTPQPPIVITRVIYPTQVMDVLWNEDLDPFGAWGLSDVQLNDNTFYPGDRIRFYADNLQDDSYITVVFADSSKPYFIDSQIPNFEVDSQGRLVLDAEGNKIRVTSGVIEVMLDEGNAEKMTSTVRQYGTIQVQGRHFKLTKIGRIPFQ